MPKKLPRYESVIPRRINTIENPNMKNKECIDATLLILDEGSRVVISSNDLPVI